MYFCYSPGPCSADDVAIEHMFCMFRTLYHVQVTARLLDQDILCLHLAVMADQIGNSGGEPYFGQSNAQGAKITADLPSAPLVVFASA